jgi:hypothetical protein
MQPNPHHPQAVDSGLKQLWFLKGRHPQGTQPIGPLESGFIKPQLSEIKDN